MNLITDNGEYYLYRHIRLDTNQPFYIGVGTKRKCQNKCKSIYARAYTKNSRNIIWNRIVSKTPYIVEILLESDDYNFIQQKEIEFIELYGCKANLTGTLSNILLGSVGSKKVTYRKIYVYNLEGQYLFECNSITECCEKTKVSPAHITEICRDISNRKQSKGYIFRYTYLPKIEKYKRGSPKNFKTKRVGKYTLDGTLVQEYLSIREACTQNNLSVGNVQSCVKGVQKTSGGFVWKYLDGCTVEKGYPHTEETKRKLSENKMAENNPNARKVINILTGEVFPTIKLAAESAGINKSTLNRMLLHDGHCQNTFYYWKK